MIFLNRRRNLNGIKNPSKYWYIEKYVYGELKETVEVPLGTSIKFGSIGSGYSDDTFYGWSVNSTSTSSTFNSTSTYSNSSVKNYLDDKNTLKIYAVYRYYVAYTLNKDVEMISDYTGETHARKITITFDQNQYSDFYIKTQALAYPPYVNTTNPNIILSITGSGSVYTGSYGTPTDYVQGGSFWASKGDTLYVEVRNYCAIKFSYKYYEQRTYYRVRR